MASTKSHPRQRDRTGPVTSRSTPAGLPSSTTPRSTAGRRSRMAERDYLGLHGLLPSAVETLDEQVARCYEQFKAKRLRRREVGLPHPAARQQRGALLPPRRRARARDAADRLHAHGRARRSRSSATCSAARVASSSTSRTSTASTGPWTRRGSGPTTSTWSSPPTPRRSSASATGASAASTSRSASSPSTPSPPASTRARVLAVGLDVGTNREELLNDPRYLGLRRSRVRGEAYDDVHRRLRRQRLGKRFPKAILHWEDFSGPPARGILARYGDTPVHLRRRHPGHRGGRAWPACWPGSGSRAAAWSTSRSWSSAPGSAGVGIADLIALAMTEDGLSAEEAAGRIYLLDRPGPAHQ